MNLSCLSLAFAKPKVRYLRQTLFALLGAFGAFTFAAPAQAGTYNLQLDLSGTILGNIDLVTGNTPAGGPFLITSATGTLNGLSVSLLSPNGVFNDNELYVQGNLYPTPSGSSPFDAIGLGLVTSDSVQWAIFYDPNFFGPGFAALGWCNNSGGQGDHTCGENPEGLVFAAVVTPTPLPAALPLFGAGLGGLVVVLRRKRKAVVA